MCEYYVCEAIFMCVSIMSETVSMYVYEAVSIHVCEYYVCEAVCMYVWSIMSKTVSVCL